AARRSVYRDSRRRLDHQGLPRAVPDVHVARRAPPAASDRQRRSAVDAGGRRGARRVRGPPRARRAVTKEEFRARLAERAGRANATVSEAMIDALDAYYRLLARWNGTINLTALSLDPLTDEALDRLFIEPMAAAPYIREALDVTPLSVWFDLGS